MAGCARGAEIRELRLNQGNRVQGQETKLRMKRTRYLEHEVRERATHHLCLGEERLKTLQGR